ncbi:MAG: hypothetical protein L6R19_17565 [Alphaproteobacteria bacterium]|nr:hypothetical protein [Alphaproteobacteria bacterium]
MRHAWIALNLAALGALLAACSSHPLMDPLGIADMRQRCREQGQSADASEAFRPVPFLACRDVPGL